MLIQADMLREAQKKNWDEPTSKYIKGSPKKKNLDKPTRSGRSQGKPVSFRWEIMRKSKHKVKFRSMKRKGKMAKKHKTQKSHTSSEIC